MAETNSNGSQFEPLWINLLWKFMCMSEYVTFCGCVFLVLLKNTKKWNSTCGHQWVPWNCCQVSEQCHTLSVHTPLLTPFVEFLLLLSFFFFFWLIYFWLHWVFAAAFGLFSSCEEQGASHCGGFSGGARVPGTGRLQQVQHTGSLIVAPKLQVPRLRSSIGG